MNKNNHAQNYWKIRFPLTVEVIGLQMAGKKTIRVAPKVNNNLM
jgi:hypothetical protein